MMKSKKLIRHLSIGLRQSDRAQTQFYCWKVNEIGLEYSDENLEKLRNAETQVYEARKVVEEVYGQMIGQEIVNEVKAGLWK